MQVMAIGPSVPPANMTLASPRRITSADSPMAWEPAAQAVLFQRLRWQVLRNSMRSVMFASSLRLAA
jgi:hypothetical protein